MPCPAVTARLLLIISLILSGSRYPLQAESSWPQWRGADGTGVSHERGIPVKWDAQQIRWRTRIPGRGQSSPVAAGGRVFLTTAARDGSSRSVVCVNQKTGALLWQREAVQGLPEKVHQMNSWATPSCATDGSRVFAYFGSGGLYCFDLQGEPLWHHDLGQLENSQWGVGSSPILFGDTVIQTCDGDNDAFLIAFDRSTGKQLWRQPRPKHRSFSTPMVIRVDRRQELVLNGHLGVHAYDPQTGQELWFCAGGSGRGTPSVTSGHNLVFAISGRSRGAGDLMAIRPGGRGAVAATHLAWQTRRGGRDLPSPLLAGDFLVAVNLRPGVATCYHAPTGKLLWKQRLEGNFSASPVAAGGYVYMQSEQGEIIVIRPDRSYREIARNRLPAENGESFRASLMPLSGKLFCRSDKYLYCIGSETPDSSNR